MTQKEAFKQITSELKWYIGYCSQGYASQLVQRFEAGQLKQKTIEKILNDFGYRKIQEAQWSKDLEGKPNNLKTK